METPKAVSENSQAIKGPAEDGLTELEVWSVPLVNRQLLICHAPQANGSDPTALVSVMVRDNSLFLKKMRLRARRVAGSSFVLEGPTPRWRGKW
jgi:hypothetical protein